MGERMSRMQKGDVDQRRTAVRSPRRWLVALAVPALALSAWGTLPSGFPSAVPVPAHSRVLAGGGTSDRWDVAFAVKGDLTAGTTAYRDQFTAAGFTVTDVQSGSTPVTGSTGANSGATTTTVTLSGSTFRAADAQWTVEVASGSTTSSTDGTLRAGEFAVNITVVPTSSTTTTTP
jgi:hypothetical protein